MEQTIIINPFYDGVNQFNDPDRWWAWNRILDWFDQQEQQLEISDQKLVKSR